jgi:hypothetical protein
MARTRLAMVYERMGRKNEAANEYLATASLMQQSGDLVKAMQIVEYIMQLLPESEEARRAMQRLRNNQPLPKPGRPRAVGISCSTCCRQRTPIVSSKRSSFC